MNRGWIGFDLDGTLAVYTTWQGLEHIGEPIKPMVDKVKEFLARGLDVRIFTARVCSKQPAENIVIATKAVQAWCSEHIGQELVVTAEKDYNLVEYYDDRAVQIEYNVGTIIG